MQSPIAIDSTSALRDLDGDPDQRLRPLHSRLVAQPVDTGHGLQANFSSGNWVTLRGRRFELQQVHFHTPAEHTIDGVRHPVEAHFVYRAANGRLAVLAAQYRSGEANVELARLLQAFAQRDHPPAVALAVDALLGPTGDYYHYLGSLTTPPLSQNVEWYVMAQPLTAAPGQIAALERSHGGNNRLVQPLNGRPVLRVTTR